MKSKPREKLVPVDRKRCQAMSTVGNFMSLGGQRIEVRCNNVATYVATETRPNIVDGRKGRMSLCVECEQVCSRQMPEGSVKYTVITRK
jgi:hypothetical protein